MAQFRFVVGSQGALPPLHWPQLTVLICQSPTSVDPLVLQLMAWALPPDSWETMHLQQFWFQEYLPHQVAMSRTFLLVPQGQLGHLPEGQFPPQESAKTKATSNRRTMIFMISYRIINQNHLNLHIRLTLQVQSPILTASHRTRSRHLAPPSLKYITFFPGSTFNYFEVSININFVQAF